MATLILKPTEACNAACAYCEVDRKGYLAKKIMPLELLELLFVRINEFLEEKPGERLEIIWHGGEPLLLGEDYFASAFEFQRKHCAATRDRIRHRIQSNLTLFSPKFSAIFRKLGITSVGTSYDPVDGVRVLRKKGDSKGYNKRFLEGVRLLEREGFRWGVIYVVTKLSLDRALDIFHFLTNLAPEGGVMFNPITVDKPEHAHLKITAEEFTEFLGTIFPVWWANRDRYERVEPFQSLTQGILSGGKRTFFCADSGNCSNSHINLGPKGRWSHCGRSADWGLFDYGSIVERSMSEVYADATRVELRRRNEVLSNGDCRGCKYWSICHGGCPLEAAFGNGSLMAKTAWCHSKREFFERYFIPVTGITPQFEKPAPSRTVRSVAPPRELAAVD